MIYLAWRQHRNQAVFAAVALAALALLLLVTGVHAANIYRAATRSCSTGSGFCSGMDTLFRNYGPLFDVVALTAAVPALFGLFWGAPLVARELETGTNQLAWSQTVTRNRWLAVKLCWVLVGAAVWGAAIGGLVSWWSTPINAVEQYRFQLGHFDTQGIVPIGYSVFAVALGVAAGVLLRRVLPALAVTLGGFGGVRFFVDYVLRPHYLPPLQATAALGSQPIPAHGSFWTISTGFLGPAGQHLDALRFTPGTMPAACQALVAEVKNPDGITRCLGAHGFRTVTSYQPANRFWTFQGIETLIYLAIAAVLVFVTFQLVRRRDA